MYKNCYVQRGDEWNHYRIHLWTDEGYTEEEFQNYGYQECSETQSTHKGLKGENLKVRSVIFSEVTNRNVDPSVVVNHPASK